ncbi:MAG: hypothetical protein K6A62_05850 [Bacteroidales bacterium]|nr:hypothetical protein [Bacteroidales bacterium]
MKRYLTFFLLAAALCLTACDGLFPSLDPDPAINYGESMPAEKAYSMVQSKLSPFSRRGITRSKELIPAQTTLYYLPSGASQAESIVLVKSPTWVFSVGPDANANGANEWLYVYVNAQNGEWAGHVLNGELVGLTWETVREKDAQPDSFSLFRAETLSDPASSRWLEIADGSKEIEKDGQHAWVWRIDSAAALEDAYKGTVSTEPDWNTQTLLLVAGYETTQNLPYDLTFTKQEDGSYQIQVYRLESTYTSVLWWTRAILVDKLAPDADIKVKTLFLGQ